MVGEHWLENSVEILSEYVYCIARWL